MDGVLKKINSGYEWAYLKPIAASATAMHKNPGVETRLEILNLRGKLGGEGKAIQKRNRPRVCLGLSKCYPKIILVTVHRKRLFCSSIYKA